jgi:hypothetical protein
MLRLQRTGPVPQRSEQSIEVPRLRSEPQPASGQKDSEGAVRGQVGRRRTVEPAVHAALAGQHPVQKGMAAGHPPCPARPPPLLLVLRFPTYTRLWSFLLEFGRWGTNTPKSRS